MTYLNETKSDLAFSYFAPCFFPIKELNEANLFLNAYIYRSQSAPPYFAAATALVVFRDVEFRKSFRNRFQNATSIVTDRSGFFMKNKTAPFP